MNYPQSTVDLSQYDSEFEEAPVQEHEFDNLPDGKYEVIVDRVMITTSKGTGDPLVKWTLKIEAPRYIGRLVWRYNGFATKQQISWLKTDLYFCGLRLGRLSELEQHLDELRGIRLAVTLKTKGDFQSVFFNKVLDTKPVADSGNGAGGPLSNRAEQLAGDDVPF